MTLRVQRSALNEQPEAYIEIIETQLKQLMEDHARHEARSNAIVERMIEILNRLREKDPKIPEATKGVTNDKHIARLLGETGPLGDFHTWRMLTRYAGLNIRMRQSGRYSGQNKITKKGRPLLQGQKKYLKQNSGEKTRKRLSYLFCNRISKAKTIFDSISFSCRKYFQGEKDRVLYTEKLELDF